MTVLYVNEYELIAQGYPAPMTPPLVAQTVSIGASSTQSAAFNALTRFVTVSADATCSIAWGSNPVATSSNDRIDANEPLRSYGVLPGSKVAVITNS